MSLKDYAVNRDKFERSGNGSGSLTLDFPCCVCFHRFRKDTEEPCRTCDHNVNAVKDAPPVQSDQSPCSSCGGAGVIYYNPNLNPNEFPGVASEKCGWCNGTGLDTDPHEKDESRAGIEPFQVNAER